MTTKSTHQAEWHTRNSYQFESQGKLRRADEVWSADYRDCFLHVARIDGGLWSAWVQHDTGFKDDRDRLDGFATLDEAKTWAESMVHT